MNKGYYITTAIAYVNSPPHIGFAYEVIGADIMARFQRLRGRETFFLTGSDEHSLNVYRKAKEANLSPQQYCDQMADLYIETWKKLGISYNRFIRTSSEEHKKAVNVLVDKLRKTPYVYRGKYAGWYCISCENFYSEKELIDGLCPIHKRKPEWVEEENYFFALSKFEDFLKELILENPEFIEPEERRNEVIGILKEGLRDVSISRKGTAWGIPFPGTDNERVYVWVDALINYLSGIGYGWESSNFDKFWPADIHIIGKDIIRFHCLLWPALLKAVGLPLPHKVFIHGFINLEGEKISSTRGNILSPEELLKEYPPDALRFYLFREIPFGQDGDFSLKNLKERYNRELANDWGNLFRRTVIMLDKYLEGKIPSRQGFEGKDREIKSLSEKVFEKVTENMENLKFSQALIEIWKLVKRANQYVEENAPWKLYQIKDFKNLERVLYNTLEMIRVVAILLLPFLPFSSKKILEDLGVEGSSWEEAKIWGKLPPRRKVPVSPPIFPRKK
ncbi:methionine--tRNA ligase [Candidatus Calescamantes bacterium]|nr:methionine--tRNA ligase [Candidatus Calescamantes bacterium]